MELHKALKQIIDTQGPEIIQDLRLVNLLDDFKAYEEIPSSKYILRAIITDGYSQKLLELGSWNNQSVAIVNKFASLTGFIPKNVNIIFHSLAYALGWKDEIDNSFNDIIDVITEDISFKTTIDSDYKKNQHASFKGIPINGNCEEFTEACKKIGLTPSTKKFENFALFFGTFAEIEDCDFRVDFSPFSGQAYQVQVWLPSQDTWTECKTRYFEFKERLINKYGQPTSSFEFFEYPFASDEGKGNEMEILRQEKIIYSSVFRKDNTAVELTIYKYGDLHITYEDKINADFHYSKAREVLNSDL